MSALPRRLALGLSLLIAISAALASAALAFAQQAIPAGTVLLPTQASAASPHVVAIDPGHGGPDPGAIAGDLVERDLNLPIALDLATQLRDKGFAVVLTRTTEAVVNPDYVAAPDRQAARRDLQARIDAANAAGAGAFVSIHNNSSTVAAERGAEIWYDPNRPFADRNRALAQLALQDIVASVTNAGYDDLNRGLRDDSTYRTFRDRSFPLYVLGPGSSGPRTYVPTAMPAILGETLFLSNPGDAAALRQPAILHAIASGYATALQTYFQQFG